MTSLSAREERHVDLVTNLYDRLIEALENGTIGKIAHPVEIVDTCRFYECTDIEFFHALADAIESIRNQRNDPSDPYTWDPVIEFPSISMKLGTVRNYRYDKSAQEGN